MMDFVDGSESKWSVSLMPFKINLLNTRGNHMNYIGATSDFRTHPTLFHNVIILSWCDKDIITSFQDANDSVVIECTLYTLIICGTLFVPIVEAYECREAIDILSTYHYDSNLESFIFGNSYSCNSNVPKEYEEGCFVRTAGKDGDGINFVSTT